METPAHSPAALFAGPAIPISVPGLAQSYRHGLLVRRWLGCWIDLLVFAAIFLVPDFVLGNDRYQTLLPVWLILGAGYYPVCEWRFGRTLGKLAAGTIVVREDGGNPTLTQALIRTALRIFEVNPFLAGGIPAAIVVLLTRHHQRVGDLLAGTYVVCAKDLVAMEDWTSQARPPAREVPAYDDPGGEFGRS